MADAVDLPLVVYNIAGRTGKNIENPVMLELAKHPRIRAVKEASGDLNQMMDLIAAKPADFAVLSGDDNLVFPLMTLGGTGVISVASNLVPDRMVAMVGALLKGDVAAARRMHYELLPLFRAMFIETNPIPIKAALAMKGMIGESYRLPMCPLAPKSRERLAAVLKDLRLVYVVGGEPRGDHRPGDRRRTFPARDLLRDPRGPPPRRSSTSSPAGPNAATVLFLRVLRRAANSARVTRDSIERSSPEGASWQRPHLHDRRHHLGSRPEAAGLQVSTSCDRRSTSRTAR